MSKKPQVANHYTTAFCPECGAEYEKYSSKQKTCKECKPKQTSFLLYKRHRDILSKLPKDKKSQFVREAIVEKDQKTNP